MAPRIVILDGYTDEPAGLGVPPYIDVYPRYIAGTIWELEKNAVIKYYTVDQVRENPLSFYEEANRSDYTIVVAGVVVPGKYLGGNPLTPREAMEIGRLLNNTCSILVGPAAKFGMGLEGGKPAYPPVMFKKVYCSVVSGDPDAYVKNVLTEGIERTPTWIRRKNYSEIRRAAILGSRIVKQHPNHGYNLIAEIETYRGCSRWVTGGCSFCVEPLYGKPIQRDPEDILEELSSLYRHGVRGFRIGRQADILVYGSKDLGKKEFPRPNPQFIEKFFSLARKVIGDSILHIDNVNPGTISTYPTESRRALSGIIEYHTPGDVAALGLESADPRVIEINNLNTTPEEAFEAIRIINEVGGNVGWNGMPELLPGINFILGLPGETSKTFEENISFLQRIKESGFLLRRINIRKIMVLPGTRVSKMWKENTIRKHKKMISRFKWIVRHVYDKYFLRKTVPKGRVLKRVYVEKAGREYSMGRQMGSYPITIIIRGVHRPPKILDVRVTGYKERSVKGEVVKEYFL
jgi:radical SAM superfamily enzyme with C-terminal helix-hairpin-helix motif